MAYSICLKGFDAEQETVIGDTVRASGHRLVRTMDLADIVVAGPNAERKLYRVSQEMGLRLTTWEMLSLEMTAAGSHSDGTCAQNEVIPMVEKGDGFVRVLDQRIPCGSGGAFEGMVPSAARFGHFCFDQAFAATLRSVCLGAAHDLPVALEGETAAAKTSAVQYLAHVAGQPMIRVNLNGQTDAGELVGRYVPSNPLDGIHVSELLGQPDGLTEFTRAILERAAAEDRRLTRVEQMMLAGRDRLASTSWRFQEGALPMAMRHGWWILFDEINLAEPQILERLNPALERPRTLVLTEGDGTAFGPGGDVGVHAGFRIFATLNPAEYAGRSVLSPAFRDRWSVWHNAATASESEYLALIRCAVLGDQPVVTIRGRRYQAARSEPVFPGIAEIPDAGSLMKQLAVFHASLEKAAGSQNSPQGIGRSRRERYTFTRRSLLSLLEMSHRMIAEGAEPSLSVIREAIEVFYIGRLRDQADRASVESLVRAAGFSR
jgi:MoxR-like ATPase